MGGTGGYILYRWLHGGILAVSRQLKLTVIIQFPSALNTKLVQQMESLLNPSDLLSGRDKVFGEASKLHLDLRLDAGSGCHRNFVLLFCTVAFNYGSLPKPAGNSKGITQNLAYKASNAILYIDLHINIVASNLCVPSTKHSGLVF